eukprot:TRINITY_DN2214_c0_g1_i1.p1 TRINITY_DN2214_c0_g1~~TRINITY_DN2214_c0_g1_i1.p1  ORF type:complete len:1044 (+),score=208.75 TRINITY_DN2214_c0_g1_i1:69-3200(+)
MSNWHAPSFLNPSELVPSISAYGDENVPRPTVEFLLAQRSDDDDPMSHFDEIPAPAPVIPTCKEQAMDICCPTEGETKFRWWDGVWLPNMISIWGVLMFVRIGWCVGQAGIGYWTAIIAVCSCITLTTAVSLSAVATNGVVKSGGVYYLISRSLGPEFGGVIGLALFVTVSVDIAQFTIGMGETIVGLYPTVAVNGTNGTIASELAFRMIDGGLWDIRIWGLVSLVVAFTICMFGVSWAVKLNMGLLFLMLFAIFSVIVGSLLPRFDISAGVVGYNATVFHRNFFPEFRAEAGVPQDFFTCLGLFFPATIGILAGANISGDLKDAQAAIPKGTFAAITTTSLTYIALGWIVGAVVDRDALYTNLYIFQVVSFWSPLILVGLFAAGLSSLMTQLVTAPRVLQGLCRDKVFPGIAWLGAGHGKNDEPVRARILSAVIALGCTLIGSLNAVAPLITNLYMLTFTFINFACFLASRSKAPGWRPSFRFFNSWYSLVGALVCVAMMLFIDWASALIAWIIAGVIYLFVKLNAPPINWGSAGQALRYREVVRNLHEISTLSAHVKTFRPSFLVMAGSVDMRASLTNFAKFLAKGKSLLIYGNVIVADPDADETREVVNEEQTLGSKYLKKRHICGFNSTIASRSLLEGARALMQVAGIGRVRPNTFVLGFKSDWRGCDEDDTIQYVQMIREAFLYNMGVVLVRGDNYPLIVKRQFSLAGSMIRKMQPCLRKLRTDNPSDDYTERKIIPPTRKKLEPERRVSRMVRFRTPSSAALPMFERSPVRFGATPHSPLAAVVVSDDSPRASAELAEGEHQSVDIKPVSDAQDASLLDNMEQSDLEVRFTPHDYEMSVVSLDPLAQLAKDLALMKLKAPPKGHEPRQAEVVRPTGTVDVYWMTDDGGLTMLLSTIIMKHSYWRKCKMRLFTVGMSAQIQAGQRVLQELVRQLRLDCEPMYLGETKAEPTEEAQRDFDKWINGSVIISDIRLAKRIIRLRELLLQHSSEASLVVCSLPVPSADVDAREYMSFADYVSHDLSMIFVRGNQENVMTAMS